MAFLIGRKNGFVFKVYLKQIYSKYIFLYELV